MAREGIDVQLLEEVVTQIRSMSQAANDRVRSLASIVEDLRWYGDDAEAFRAHWDELAAAIQNAAGRLATAQSHLLSEIQQQQQASAASSSGAHAAPIGTGTRSILGSIRHDLGAVLDDSESLLHGTSAMDKLAVFGIPALAGSLPVVEKYFDDATSADQYFDLGRDVFDRHYQQAFDDGSGLVAGNYFDAAVDVTEDGARLDPVAALAGFDITVFSDVERAARQDNLGYLSHHLSILNPAAPGALHAYADATGEAFGEVGEQMADPVIDLAKKFL